VGSAPSRCISRSGWLRCLTNILFFNILMYNLIARSRKKILLYFCGHDLCHARLIGRWMGTQPHSVSYLSCYNCTHAECCSLWIVCRQTVTDRPPVFIQISLYLVPNHPSFDEGGACRSSSFMLIYLFNVKSVFVRKIRKQMYFRN
jgi:hypothetical protein